jgi:endonuclease/exonuclease/phosphatase (EEP) superfamily protein YafD
MKLVVYVMDIWMAAVTYVMLSRICALWQLYILDEFDAKKMYPSKIAMEEHERLRKISKNNNLTEWENQESKTLKVSSLNCRSLKKHFPDIISDDMLMKSDAICLQETWLEDDSATELFEIPNYELHLNSNGRGKGIAIYFKKDTIRHVMDIKEENMQLSKFTSDVIDLVVLYRSQNGSHSALIEILETLIDREKPILVIGDFNFCFLDDSSNLTKRYFHKNFFTQLVKQPTHIEGNSIDQAHVRDMQEDNHYSLEVHSKYYTDHKGLAVLIKR